MAEENVPHILSRSGSDDGVQGMHYDVRMDGVYFFRSRPRPPFNLSLKAGDYAYCFMVRRGTLTLKIDFPFPLTFELEPGSNRR